MAASALGAYLLLYVSWQLFHWLPGDRQLGDQQWGQLLLVVVDAAALYATWRAARRCEGSPALRSFWLWMSAAIAAETIADAIQLSNDLRYAQPPFPTLADPFFLAFYVLLLIALLRVPVAPITSYKRLRILLDGTTIVLGGGALVWYFVLGPTARGSGDGTLASAVSLAYPTGDLILLAGLAAVLLRQSPPTLRLPLLLIAVGVTVAIVADVIYGYEVLHGSYTDGDPSDTLYVLEFLAFALAGVAQKPVRPQDPLAEVGDWRQPSIRASWLPYVSAPIGFGLLIGVEWNRPFFPERSLALIVMVIGGLVAARQYLALRELTQTETALRGAEQVKDEFISVVGHELRTPLTSIRGSLGLLEGGVLGELPAEAQEMLAMAVANTDRLVRLINDILDIERMDAGRLELEIEPLKAAELVAQAVGVLQRSATEARVKLRSEVADLTVSADGDRIVQVLVNLIGNAVKFSARGGVVRIGVARERDCVLFSVSDEGRGIPADQLARIFERFNQVDVSDAREKGGTGLGLSIAHGIVQRHGGRIWAESEEGRGSTFNFTLAPAADGQAPASAAGERATMPATGPVERGAAVEPAAEAGAAVEPAATGPVAEAGAAVKSTTPATGLDR
jgi:signal transduction histidine kinase